MRDADRSAHIDYLIQLAAGPDLTLPSGTIIIAGVWSWCCRKYTSTHGKPTMP